MSLGREWSAPSRMTRSRGLSPRPARPGGALLRVDAPLRDAHPRSLPSLNFFNSSQFRGTSAVSGIRRRSASRRHLAELLQRSQAPFRYVARRRALVELETRRRSCLDGRGRMRWGCLLDICVGGPLQDRANTFTEPPASPRSPYCITQLRTLALRGGTCLRSERLTLHRACTPQQLELSTLRKWTRHFSTDQSPSKNQVCSTQTQRWDLRLRQPERARAPHFFNTYH
jgi:hypothetical protein